MNTQLLKRLHSIYSPSGKEQKMVVFLCSYIKKLPGNISVLENKFGDPYVVKGEAETYPCLVSHTDQVPHCSHSEDSKAVETGEIISGYSPKHKRLENLGVDDKSGVFICLEYLKEYDSIKVALFREEGTGCRGSSEAVMSFFNDVRSAIQSDRKGSLGPITSIGYADLYPEGFTEATESEKWGYMEEDGSMTGILVLKEEGSEVSYLDVSCGYYNTHTDEEIMIKRDLMKSLLFVEHIMEDCTNTYLRIQSDSHLSLYESKDEIYDILNNDPTSTPKDLYEVYPTDFPHLRPDDYERICRDYRILWREYEEYKLINDNGYENEKILS